MEKVKIKMKTYIMVDIESNGPMSGDYTVFFKDHLNKIMNLPYFKASLVIENPKKNDIS